MAYILLYVEKHCLEKLKLVESDHSCLKFPCETSIVAFKYKIHQSSKSIYGTTITIKFQRFLLLFLLYTRVKEISGIYCNKYSLVFSFLVWTLTIFISFRIAL